MTSTQLIDDFQMVREYALAHAAAAKNALDREASLKLIEQLAREIE